MLITCDECKTDLHLDVYFEPYEDHLEAIDRVLKARLTPREYQEIQEQIRQERIR